MSTAIDTNVLVRFIARDDPEQHQKAARLLARTSCYVLDTVVLETEWVLRKTFRYSREQIAAAFDVLGNVEGLSAESPARLDIAIAAYKGGMEFADAFHLAGATKASAFATFDKALIKRAKSSFADLPVILP